MTAEANNRLSPRFYAHTRNISDRKTGRIEGDPAKSGPEPERPAAARKFGNRTLKPP